MTIIDEYIPPINFFLTPNTSATKVLELIRSRVEQIENPFFTDVAIPASSRTLTISSTMSSEYKAFESCRKAVLELLK